MNTEKEWIKKKNESKYKSNTEKVLECIKKEKKVNKKSDIRQWRKIKGKNMS